MDIGANSPFDEVVKESTAAPETETVHVGVGSAPVVVADEQRRRWILRNVTYLSLLCSFALTLWSMWVPHEKVDLFSSATLSTNTPYEKSLCSEGCGAVNSTGVGHQYELVRTHTQPTQILPSGAKVAEKRRSGFLQELYDAHGGASTYECVSTDDGYTVRLLFHYGELYSSYKTSCTDPMRQETVFEGEVLYEECAFGRQVVGTDDRIKEVNVFGVFSVIMLIAHALAFLHLLVVRLRRDWKMENLFIGCLLVWLFACIFQFVLWLNALLLSQTRYVDGGSTLSVRSTVGKCIAIEALKLPLFVWVFMLLCLNAE
ncbi:hypothetical protein AGDE_17177 [Angomonas deanei]|nr:hypothetical protein AGDE_17177 [Angomonas deanei]|eukprot:EPY15101.1 hypothetical protein AGDE_17177 [Angomonas deanei]